VGNQVYGTTQASYGGGQGVQLWTLDLGAGPAGSQANFYASLANPAANDYFYGQFDQIFVVDDDGAGSSPPGGTVPLPATSWLLALGLAASTFTTRRARRHRA
ncbi:hypothetical protein MOJ79_08725, partial [Calidifontimicrobium sp. SYSU G02091]|uniref:hypothetical protein n=1 Tax=Calidifontimicrobium sp. SYSU G02091 TaxID=2926421 RepID=UPI001F52EDFE